MFRHDRKPLERVVPPLALRELAPLTAVGVTSESRENPYFVRGRDRELLSLIKSINDLPHSARLIIGPPGSGKTAMLTYIHRYAQAVGIEVVRLTPANFRSERSLINRLLGTQPEESETSTGWELEANIKIARVSRKRGTKTSSMGAATINDAVRIRATKERRRGLLILLDEVQRFARADETQRERAAELIETVHIDTPRDDAGNSCPTGLILCGHLNTLRILHRMEVSRIDSLQAIRLENLSDAAVYQVLSDHLGVIKTKRKSPGPQLHDLQAIIGETGGFPDFVAKAGGLLQTSVQKNV